MNSDKTNQFDAYCTNDELNILKIMTFYMDNPLRNATAAYIFLSQLCLFCNHTGKPSKMTTETDHAVTSFLEDIRPFCETNPSLNELFSGYCQYEQLKQMLELISVLKASGDTTENMKDFASFFSENTQETDFLHLWEQFSSDDDISSANSS